MDSPPFAASRHICGCIFLDSACPLAQACVKDTRFREAIAMKAFETEIAESNGVLTGPWRKPQQMLHAQTYDLHASIHDDATAQKLGFQGGTIEGPTHFSQFAPLCERLLGQGLVRDRLPVGALPQSRLRGRRGAGERRDAEAGRAHLHYRHDEASDGTEILRGTASVGRDVTETALSLRLKELKPLTDPVILNRHQGRHEDDATDRDDGRRPAHGRPLSVLAGRRSSR